MGKAVTSTSEECPCTYCKPLWIRASAKCLGGLMKNARCEKSTCFSNVCSYKFKTEIGNAVEQNLCNFTKKCSVI